MLDGVNSGREAECAVCKTRSYRGQNLDHVPCPRTLQLTELKAIEPKRLTEERCEIASVAVLAWRSAAQRASNDSKLPSEHEAEHPSSHLLERQLPGKRGAL